MSNTWRSNWNSRHTSVGLALAVASPSIALFLWTAVDQVTHRDANTAYVPPRGELGLALALGAIATVSVLAWKLAPRVRSAPSRFPWRLLVGGSLLTLVLGAFTTSFVLSVMAAFDDAKNIVGYLVLLPLYYGAVGLILYGLPMLVLVVPSGVVWLYAMRRWVAVASEDGPLSPRTSCVPHG